MRDILLAKQAQQIVISAEQSFFHSPFYASKMKNFPPIFPNFSIEKIQQYEQFFSHLASNYNVAAYLY